MGQICVTSSPLMVVVVGSQDCTVFLAQQYLDYGKIALYNGLFKCCINYCTLSKYHNAAVNQAVHYHNQRIKKAENTVLYNHPM